MCFTDAMNGPHAEPPEAPESGLLGSNRNVLRGQHILGRRATTSSRLRLLRDRTGRILALAGVAITGSPLRWKQGAG